MSEKVSTPVLQPEPDIEISVTTCGQSPSSILEHALKSPDISLGIRYPHEEFLLSINPSGAVGDIKRKIQEKKGILIDKQTVYFAGKPRVDERRFKDCGIQVGSHIFVVVKPTSPS